MFGCELLHRGIGRAARKGFGCSPFGLAIGPEKIETFGQANPIRTVLGGCALDKSGGRGDIGGFIADRVHLNQGKLHENAPAVILPASIITAALWRDFFRNMQLSLPKSQRVRPTLAS